MTIELTEAQARRAEAAYIVPSQSPVPADFVEKVHQMEKTVDARAPAIASGLGF
jgi:hypothetical protein